MKGLLDRFFLTRPVVLIPAWAFLGTGYLRALESGGDTATRYEAILLPFLLLTLMLAGVYVINQIYDRDTDRENGKLFLIAQGHVSLRDAWIEALLLVLVSLIAAALFRPADLPWLAGSGLLGFLYSADPVRLKGRPIADMIANAVGYGGVTFLYGFSLVRAPGTEDLLHALPYIFLVGGVFLHTALVDVRGDRKAGLRTSAVLLGPRGTSTFAFVLLVLAAGAGVLLGEPYPTLAAIGASPFFLWGLIRPGEKGSTLSFQWGSLLFILLLVIRAPWFGFFLVGLLAVTRLYYKLRFHMVYPRLDF
ncbi:MAG: UbiA family prenyltransferase [Candidatus Eisenbacteria bacterium]|nr:UbiA family prenyltransferase [Candidatus Eisenbacteria bacterium]